MGQEKKEAKGVARLLIKLLGQIVLHVLLFIVLFIVLLQGRVLVLGAYVTVMSSATLSNLQRELLDGYAKLSNVFPRADWDTACIVRIYSDLKDPETLKRHFGQDYRYNWLTTPNTHGMLYGVGFSFLQHGKFVRFIEIPSGRLDPITYFRKYGKIGGWGKQGWFVPSTVEVLLPEGQAKQLQISSFDFKSQKKDDDCFSRSSGFIQIIDHRKILIGE